MGSFQLKIIIPFLPCSGCDIIEGGCITPSKLFWFRHQGSIFPYRFTGDPTQKGTRDDDIIPMKDFSYLVACRLRLLIYQHKLYMIGKSYYPACFCLHVGYSQHIQPASNRQLWRMFPWWMPMFSGNSLSIA